jgi:hypothetical protein
MSLGHAQDEQPKLTKIIEATFDSKSEEGFIFFNRMNESAIVFAQIEPRLLQRFNLNDDSLEGSTFKITYGTEKFYPEGDDAGNSLPIREQLIILDLELVE